MSRSLPPKPSLRYLKEEAKDLLKAQRHGDASACRMFRLLRRFQNTNDQEILAADVALAEAQFALAMDYGYQSWSAMVQHVRKLERPQGISLDAVRQRCRMEIPEYGGAGVPLGVVAALNHAGVEIDFAEFAAASGWAFSFGYKYEDISPAFMAVRGDPKQDGPYEVFAFLPTRLGFGYQMARTAKPDEFWPFVVKHVDAGTPIISEHLDGGLITAYRELEGKRQVLFDGTTGGGWLDADKLHPYAVYVLVREHDPAPQEQVTSEAIARAVKKGSPHEWGGAPQGLAALNTYLADVADPGKDFGNHGEWFCWATFERLAARRFAAEWLGSIGSSVPNAAMTHVQAASGHYQRAFEQYEHYRAATQAGEPTPRSLQDRARTPERIAVIAPFLKAGIEAEAQGLQELSHVVRVQGRK